MSCSRCSGVPRTEFLCLIVKRLNAEFGRVVRGRLARQYLMFSSECPVHGLWRREDLVESPGHLVCPQTLAAKVEVVVLLEARPFRVDNRGAHGTAP